MAPPALGTVPSGQSLQPNNPKPGGSVLDNEQPSNVLTPSPSPRPGRLPGPTCINRPVMSVGQDMV